MKVRFLFAALALMIATTGCKTLETDWMPKAPWDKSDEIVERDFDTPVRMAAIWSPDVMVRPGAPAARGFGGRLYFYNQNNKPVKVEGQLVVYAYDDTAEESQRESPDRKYAFTPEQFTSHQSESDLGPSYSVWLPWDNSTTGKQMSVSLLPVFTSSAGKIVMGQQALNLLPGKKPTQQDRPQATPTLSQRAISGVRPAGFQGLQQQRATSATTATSIDQLRQSSIQTTTIDLPRAMQQRIIDAAKNRKPLPASAADPVLVEQAKQKLQELRANSSLPVTAKPPALPQSSTRFAPPRPRAPSLPTSQSTFSGAQTRPVPQVRQFAPPSTPTLPQQNVAVGFGSTVR